MKLIICILLTLFCLELNAQCCKTYRVSEQSIDCGPTEYSQNLLCDQLFFWEVNFQTYGDAGVFTHTENGCTYTLNVTVEDCGPNCDYVITSTAVIVDETCGSDSTDDGSIDVSLNVTNPVTGTWLWSNGATTEDLTGLSAGDYSYTFTDSEPCPHTGTYTVLDLNEDCGTVCPTINIGGTPTCLNAKCQTVEICLNHNSDIDFYNASIIIEGHPNFSSSAQPTLAQALSVLLNNANSANIGTFTGQIVTVSGCTEAITLTKDGGCFDFVTANVFIFQNDFTELNHLTNTESCCTGSVTVTPSGMTYLWSNGSTSQNLTDLCAGTYTVTVTDSNNCTGTSSFTVDNCETNCTLDVSLTEVDISCTSGGGLFPNVTGSTGNTSYEWDRLNFPIDNNGEADLECVNDGTYRLIIQDESCCKDTVIGTVTEDLVFGCIEGLRLVEGIFANTTADCNMDLWTSACSGSQQTTPPLIDNGQDGANNGAEVQLWKKNECDNTWFEFDQMFVSSGVIAHCTPLHGCGPTGAPCGSHNGGFRFCDVPCGEYFLYSKPVGTFVNNPCTGGNGIYDFDNDGSSNNLMTPNVTGPSTTPTFVFTGGTYRQMSFGFRE